MSLVYHVYIVARNGRGDFSFPVVLALSRLTTLRSVVLLEL
jgi:hypothetical protein